MQDISGVGVQEANASALANERNKNARNTNKPLYIVRTEDPSKTKKIRILAAIEIREEPVTLDITGFDVDNETQSTLTNLTDALEYVNEGKVKIIKTKIPWARIIELENRSYKRKAR